MNKNKIYRGFATDDGCFFCRIPEGTFANYPVLYRATLYIYKNEGKIIETKKTRKA